MSELPPSGHGAVVSMRPAGLAWASTSMTGSGVRPTRLCAEIGLRSSNASAVLRTLEDKGMIERIPSQEDRRSVSVHPTPLAARNLERVGGEWARFLAPHVDEELDLAPVIDLLGALHRSVTQAAGPLRWRVA